MYFSDVSSVNEKKQTSSSVKVANNQNTTKKVQNNKTADLSIRNGKSQIHNTEKVQIQNLTDLYEKKNNQLKEFNLDYNHLLLAFDSLTIVVRHINEQVHIINLIYKRYPEKIYQT